MSPSGLCSIVMDYPRCLLVSVSASLRYSTARRTASAGLLTIPPLLPRMFLGRAITYSVSCLLDVCCNPLPVLPGCSWERHAPAWLLEPDWSPALPGGALAQDLRHGHLVLRGVLPHANKGWSAVRHSLQAETQAAESTSACSSTVCVACSCLSGG